MFCFSQDEPPARRRAETRRGFFGESNSRQAKTMLKVVLQQRLVFAAAANLTNTIIETQLNYIEHQSKNQKINDDI